MTPTSKMIQFEIDNNLQLLMYNVLNDKYKITLYLNKNTTNYELYVYNYKLKRNVLSTTNYEIEKNAIYEYNNLKRQLLNERVIH